MSSKRRNEWLEADSEEDEIDERLNEEEIGRGQSLAGQSSKRRRMPLDVLSPEEEGNQVEDEDVDDYLMTYPRLEIEQLSKVEKSLKKARDASSRSGVIYISRIPPFMKPHTVKNLLSPYAPAGLGRVFLTPESFETRQSRLRNGGNKKKSFTDGWVEFTSKREAKLVVDTLNTRNIGGKKGGYYVDDVWNLKYLKGFKWRHLTEQIANENAERAARMRAEGASSRREMNDFLKNVDRSKIQSTRQQKREAKALKIGDTLAHPSDRTDQRIFRQNQPISAPSHQSDRDSRSNNINHVLEGIF